MARTPSREFRGDRLKEIRMARGLTQADLAAILHSGQNQITSYENGKKEPTHAVLTRLSKALEVTTDYLLGLVDKPTERVEVSDVSAAERKIVMAYRRGDYKEVMRLMSENPPPDDE